MSHKLNTAIAVIGIDIGKNSFHLGEDKRGAIVLRQKWSRGQVEARLANLSPCLIGMEACVGAHHLSRNPGDPSGATQYFVLLQWAGDRLMNIRDFRYARYVTEGDGPRN
jgi:hypothetical protein